MYIIVDLVKRDLLTLVSEIQRYRNDRYYYYYYYCYYYYYYICTLLATLICLVCVCGAAQIALTKSKLV